MEKVNQGQTDLISVIIPVYKVEKYLDKCVQSVVDQTYRNLEIILVDDGSPDRCGEMCDAWAQKDSRIKVIHKTNGGISDARNAGLDISTGEYIAFVDSDDYIHPNMLKNLFNLTQVYQADMVMCGYEVVSESGELISPVLPTLANECILDKNEAFRLTDHGEFVIAWNKLYKKCLFLTVRFPYGKIAEDAFIMHELIYNASRICACSQPLYSYVQTPHSIMRSSNSIRNLDRVEARYERIRFLEKKRLHYLCDNTAKIAFYIFIDLWKSLSHQSNKERIRFREVKKMVRYCIKRHGSEISMREIISFEFPHLFRFLQHIRNRMLFRK